MLLSGQYMGDALPFGINLSPSDLVERNPMPRRTFLNRYLGNQNFEGVYLSDDAMYFAVRVVNGVPAAFQFNTAGFTGLIMKNGNIDVVNSIDGILPPVGNALVPFTAFGTHTVQISQNLYAYVPGGGSLYEVLLYAKYSWKFGQILSIRVLDAARAQAMPAGVTLFILRFKGNFTWDATLQTQMSTFILDGPQRDESGDTWDRWLSKHVIVLRERLTPGGFALLSHRLRDAMHLAMDDYSAGWFGVVDVTTSWWDISAVLHQIRRSVVENEEVEQEIRSAVCTHYCLLVTLIVACGQYYR